MTVEPVNWRSVVFMGGLMTVMCGAIIAGVKLLERSSQPERSR